MKNTVIILIFWTLLTAKSSAQVEVTYDIISTTGKIIDTSSGKELQVGDRISFQTELRFNSLHDRAVLLNPEKIKYFLELPRSSFVNSQLTVASNYALSPVKARPALITGIRGNNALITNGLSPHSLREYFAIDTFTVVGNSFTFPVARGDAERFDLLIRYENENRIEEYISSNFTIARDDLKLQGNGIAECFILLKEGNSVVPVTLISLFFVEKNQLFREFDSLLNAMNQRKEDIDATIGILRQYCTDVYGMIDRNTLESTINDYLPLN